MGASRHPSQPAGSAVAGRVSTLTRSRPQGRRRPCSYRAADRCDSPGGAGMTEIAGPIAHFLAFTAMLRRAGFPVAPEQTMAWLAAIELLGPAEVDDLRRAARATLAPPPERFAEFDALFDAHFLGALHPGEASQPRDEAPLQAAEEGTGGLEPIFGEETRESGARATPAERLSARHFEAESEDLTLRRFAR